MTLLPMKDDKTYVTWWYHDTFTHERRQNLRAAVGKGWRPGGGMTSQHAITKDLRAVLGVSQRRVSSGIKLQQTVVLRIQGVTDIRSYSAEQSKHRYSVSILAAADILLVTCSERERNG